MQDTQKESSRREFLTKSVLGLSSIGLVGLSDKLNLFAQDKPKIEKENKETDKKIQSKKIIYRTLGRTGIKLPIVSMGVMNADLPELIKKSYELGIRHFDTAAGYQDGRNEEMVGDMIKEIGVRNKVTISTKINIKKRDQEPDAIKKEFLETFEGSLKRLKMKYVDILYVHSVNKPEYMNNQGIKDALTLLKKQKKIRFCGVSTHSDMGKVLNEAANGGFYDVVLAAFNFTLSKDKDLQDAIKNAAAKGVGIIAMKTQAAGRRNSDTKNTGKINQTAALKWVLNNENITTAIPGYTNFDHMTEDFSPAYGLDYTPEEKEFLSNKNALLGFGFCIQCSNCRAKCPFGVDIPNLMRTHMYAAQYNNFYEARSTMNDIAPNEGLNNCKNCDTCKSECFRSVNISKRIDELKLIYA